VSIITEILPFIEGHVFAGIFTKRNMDCNESRDRVECRLEGGFPLTVPHPQSRNWGDFLNQFFNMENDNMFSEYLLSDWGEGSGSGGSGGGGEGCGPMILIFLACLALGSMCNNSRVNENYLKPATQQITEPLKGQDETNDTQR
jgi:hypothetical protein